MALAQEADITRDRSIGFLTILPLDVLADEINSAHRSVQLHAKGMLLEAKRAGEALINVRDEKPAEGFKAWVTANTVLSRSQAYRYIAVAERAVSCGQDTLADISIDAFLGYDKPKPTKPTFDRNDAEHALKLHALAERGVGGERENAKGKLASYADSFGMTAEEAVAKAKGMCPEANLSATAEKLRDRLRQLPKDKLIDMIFELLQKEQRDAK